MHPRSMRDLHAVDFNFRVVRHGALVTTLVATSDQALCEAFGSARAHDALHCDVYVCGCDSWTQPSHAAEYLICAVEMCAAGE